MAPRIRVTKDDILSAAVDLVRQEGADALNARAIAARLGCSTQPVFSNYATMDLLRQEVIGAADALWQKQSQELMASETYPPYKAAGMAYIGFARQERELFRLLFMRNRGESKDFNSQPLEQSVAMLEQGLGLSREAALRFHLEMWIYVHGIATMLATGFLSWDEEMASGMLTDVYQGLRLRFMKQGGNGQ